MDKIICLVGESGSGKSSIAELLEKQGYNYIESYTTRPKRYEGERGHIFVDTVPTVLNKMIGFREGVKRKQGIIADTFFNGHYYWSTREQYQEKGTSIYIVDVEGVKAIKERVLDAEIVVIYLQAERKTRMNRMLMERDPCTVVDRIRHDKEAFKIVPCDYVVDANRDIEEVLKDVMTLIEMDK